jgi:AcrR family transcriptional regulator
MRLTSGKLRDGQRNGRISITAVAKDAGVTPALIHNRYPEFAAKIHAYLGRGRGKKSAERTRNIDSVAVEACDLRRRIAALESDLARLASINAALRIDNVELRAILNSKNVSAIPSSFERSR